MKQYVLLFSILMAACSPKTEVVDVFKGDPGKNGTNCTLVSLDSGALLSCDDGTNITISDGKDGFNGTDGLNGGDGNSCQVSQDESGVNIQCGDSFANISDGEDGRDGQDGENGHDGSDGENGKDGKDGTNGSSVTITQYSPNSCTLVSGTSTYIKYTGSNNVGIYSSSSCSSNTKLYEMSQGEAYWVSSTKLAVWKSSGLSVINF